MNTTYIKFCVSFILRAIKFDTDMKRKHLLTRHKRISLKWIVLGHYSVILLLWNIHFVLCESWTLHVIHIINYR